MNRVYVHAGPGPVSRSRLLDSLRAGRTFATNGPLLELAVGGRGPGEEVRLGENGGKVAVRVRLRSNVAVDHLELVRNGAVALEIPLAGDRTAIDTAVQLTVDASGWVLLRARSDRAIYPVLDLYPYATTSPVYLSAGSHPVRSRHDAEYFLRWIDRLEAFAKDNRDWNSDAERAHVLDQIARARVELEGRAKGER